MTARISSDFRILYSLPSNLTSVPPYLLTSTRSPFLTSKGTFLPWSSVLPVPRATTTLSIGFSLAVSGMMIPPFFNFSSTASTRIRSPTGLTFGVMVVFLCCFDLTISWRCASVPGATRLLNGNYLGLEYPRCLAARWPARVQWWAVSSHLQRTLWGRVRRLTGLPAPVLLRTPPARLQVVGRANGGGARLCAEHLPQRVGRCSRVERLPRAAAGSSTTAALQQLGDARRRRDS